MMQAQIVTTPTSVTVQIVLDSVQAKYPGNEWVKPCGPDNHEGTCYDQSMPHLVYRIYSSKINCESDEGVSCAELAGIWIPIGKPVAEVVEDEEVLRDH